MIRARFAGYQKRSGFIAVSYGTYSHSCARHMSDMQLTHVSHVTMRMWDMTHAAWFFYMNKYTRETWHIPNEFGVRFREASLGCICVSHITHSDEMWDMTHAYVRQEVLLSCLPFFQYTTCHFICIVPKNIQCRRWCSCLSCLHHVCVCVCMCVCVCVYVHQ